MIENVEAASPALTNQVGVVAFMENDRGVAVTTSDFREVLSSKGQEGRTQTFILTTTSRCLRLEMNSST